jgi:hypothetical protein
LALLPRLIGCVRAASAARPLGLPARLAARPAEVYANTKQRLVGDALARIDAATLDDDLAVSALWSTDSSRAARRAHVSKNL